MRKQLLCSGCSLVGMAFLAGLAACSDNKSHADAGPACEAGTPSAGYVIIGDMEATTHGPIRFATGIELPLTAGYWYNSGASFVSTDGGANDTSDPPQMSFVFSALPSPTTRMGCS